MGIKTTTGKHRYTGVKRFTEIHFVMEMSTGGSSLRTAQSFLSGRTIPNKKRNAPLRTVHLSGRSQVICQLSLYQCKGMSGNAASHVFCNQASKT